MAFRVGQKVVRIPVGNEVGRGSDFLQGKADRGRPIIGNVYTIRAINVWPRYTLLRFQEFDYSHLIGVGGGSIEPGWDSRGFRPVVERKTDISIFKKMLTDTRVKEPAQ